MMNGALVVVYKGDEGKLARSPFFGIARVSIESGHLYLHGESGELQAIYADYEWVSVENMGKPRKPEEVKA